MISSLEALALWFSTGFLRRMARDSLNNSKDQWSDYLSIILQLLKISCVIFVYIGFDKSGERSKRDLIFWNSRLTYRTLYIQNIAQLIFNNCKFNN